MPEFDVDDRNASAIADICRRLDGIALAIELAAARVRALNVDDILARLDDRFRLLTGGSRALPRHQTLQATMHWSHDLLTPPEQRLFRHLAVFAGDCTLAAAAAVNGDGDRIGATDLIIDGLDRGTSRTPVASLSTRRSLRPGSRNREKRWARTRSKRHNAKAGSSATMRLSRSWSGGWQRGRNPSPHDAARHGRSAGAKPVHRWGIS